VSIAYPDSRGNLISAVADKPFANTDVLPEFVSNVTTVQVGGVNNFSPVNYRVYHWIPTVPSAEQITFTLQVP
jgi:hypothetical protein